MIEYLTALALGTATPTMPEYPPKQYAIIESEKRNVEIRKNRKQRRAEAKRR